MDFDKLQNLVDDGIFLDLDNADEHEVGVIFENNEGEKQRVEFTPEKYQDEEELAATINTTVVRKNLGK
jgi:hypothetical protein